jgi:hypothetical protein
MRQLAAFALSALTPFMVGSCQPGPSRGDAASTLEAAVLRHEKRDDSNPLVHARKVDCWGKVSPFRGHPAFRCWISYREPDAGVSEACFALVGKALYQVGGCFDPMRDLGAGKGRLLSRG